MPGRTPAEDSKADGSPSAAIQTDPFPSIPPALLNSADIEDYARTISLITPFNPGRLKPASYGIGVGASYATVKQRSKLRGGGWEWLFEQVDDQNGLIPLRPNSIVYVSLDTRIRLPLFIAARFNLAIRHVYRGLLAGTGPLVDPGFDSELYVPLHNLASVEYFLRPREPLIWMEFTKVSPNPIWVGDDRAEPARYGLPRGFPKANAERTSLADYLEQASTIPIRSSIESALTDVRKAAESAQADVRRLRYIGLVGLIALVAAIAVLVVSMLSLVNDVDSKTSTPSSTSTTTPVTAPRTAATNR